VKGKIFLAGNAMVLAVVAACSYSDPLPQFGVDVFVVADGVKYSIADGAPPIPADTRQVRVVADVTAPPGDWQLSLAAVGALSFQGPDAGAVSSTVHGLGDVYAEVEFAAVPQPIGEAIVQASLGTFTKTFRFLVAPVVPQVRLCKANQDGSCVDPVGEVKDAGQSYVDDAGIAWLPVSATSGDTPRDGDRAVLVISTDVSPTRDGVSWTGTVVTTGVLSLANDSKSTGSQAIEFKQGSGSVVIPVLIKGAGAGSAFASIGTGPKASLFIQTFSAAVVPRRVEFLEHVGLQARNRVSMCSTRLSGSLRVSLDLDGGAVLPAVAPLSLMPGGACVEPFPGQADFVWTGSEGHPIWTVKDELGDASTFVSVPTLGTEISVQVRDVSVVLLQDSGVDAGGSAGTIVNVAGTLWRNAYGQDGGLPSERLAYTEVVAKGQPGITLSSAPFTTDVDGNFSLEVTKATWVSDLSILLEVDHRVSVPLIFKP
jgi:hypothetical protein